MTVALPDYLQPAFLVCLDCSQTAQSMLQCTEPLCPRPQHRWVSYISDAATLCCNLEATGTTSHSDTNIWSAMVPCQNQHRAATLQRDNMLLLLSGVNHTSALYSSFNHRPQATGHVVNHIISITAAVKSADVYVAAVSNAVLRWSQPAGRGWTFSQQHQP